MKLIEEGITASNWKSIVTCLRCCRKYEITWEDISVQPNTKEGIFEQKVGLKWTANCPCGHTIVLKDRKIPNVVKQSVIDDLSFQQKLLILLYFSL